MNIMYKHIHLNFGVISFINKEMVTFIQLRDTYKFGLVYVYLGRVLNVGGASRRHFRSQRKCPVSSVSFSWDVRGTSTTKSTVTERVKRVMVVYTRSFDFFYVLICCFVHGKQLVSCRDSQLLNHTVPRQVSRRLLTCV